MSEATLQETRELPAFKGVTDVRKLMFLDAYLETASIRKALEFSGASRPAFLAWQALDTEFMTAFERSRMMVAGHLEDEAVRRAVDGVERDVYYQGEFCGSYREYSDSLLILLLKANFPERYMDRFQGSVTDEQGMADRLTMGRKRVQELRLASQKQLAPGPSLVVGHPEPEGLGLGMLDGQPEQRGAANEARELPLRHSQLEQNGPQRAPELGARARTPGGKAE